MGFWNFLICVSLIVAPQFAAAGDSQDLGYGQIYSSLYFHYPPDPVNPRTLNFFLPVEQLSLPCFLPIEIKAAYNSYSNDSSLFGQKWTFNHNIRVKSARTKFQVLEADGFWNPYTREKNLEEAKKHLIDELLIAKKKVDSKKGGLKAPSVYEEYKNQLSNDVAFLEEQESKLGTSRPLGPGTYYSLARGPSTLEMKTDGSFVRGFQNGNKEFFDRLGHLIRSEDRNQNYLAYVYQDDNLVRINDMCGRYVSFTYKADKAFKGLVDTITDSIGRVMKYEFLPGRKLKSVLDASRQLTEYTYDKVGNILTITTTPPPPNNSKKETITLSYNDKYEVQKQVGPGTEESTFKRTFVANNQSHSITEIMRYKNAKLQSRELQEFKLREFEIVTKFDGAGKQVKKEIKKISPQTGYPISVLDEAGNGDLFTYDAETGNLLKRTSVPDNEGLEFSYDKNCNQVNRMILTKGSKTVLSDTVFKFDSHCNLLDAQETKDQKKRVWITLQYSKQGKIAFLTDRIANKQVGFTFWKYGKPESITLKDVGTLLVKYSAAGEIEKVDTFPNGKGKKRFEKVPKQSYQGAILSEVRTTLDGMLNYLRPAGLNIGL